MGGGCRFSITTGSAPMPDPSDGAVDGFADSSDDAPGPLVTGPTDAAPDHATVPLPDGGSCSGDDANVCELASSVCADDRWLAYFTNATCAEGRCRWDIGYRDCGSVGACVGHGCRLNITLPNPP